MIIHLLSHHVAGEITGVQEGDEVGYCLYILIFKMINILCTFRFWIWISVSAVEMELVISSFIN